MISFRAVSLATNDDNLDVISSATLYHVQKPQKPNFLQTNNKFLYKYSCIFRIYVGKKEICCKRASRSPERSAVFNVLATLTQRRQHGLVSPFISMFLVVFCPLLATLCCVAVCVLYS